MSARRTAFHLGLLVAGLLVWSSAFVWLYAVVSFGCAFGWETIAIGPISLQRAVLIGLWLAHLALIALLLAVARQRLKASPNPQSLGGFFARAAFWASVVALGVTLVNYAPILGLSACL